MTLKQDIIPLLHPMGARGRQRGNQVVCVSLNPRKLTSAAVNPGMAPGNASVRLGISLSQPGLNQDCQQQAAGLIGCGDGLLFSVVTKLPQSARKDAAEPAVICAMSSDCPLVSVSEMSAKLE